MTDSLKSAFEQRKTIHQTISDEFLQIEFGLRQVEEYLFNLAPFQGDCVKTVMSPSPAKEFNGRTAEEAYKAFSRGHTLILHSIHKRVADVAKLAGVLGDQLGIEIRVNAYVTPPNAAGFRRHSDNHDVLILQTYGEKEWLIYPETFEPSIETTLLSDLQKAVWNVRNTHRQEVDSATPPNSKITLKKGELLFLPKGFPHEGHTSDHASVHLSLGYIYPTKAEIQSLAAFQSELDMPGGLLSPDQEPVRLTTDAVKTNHSELPALLEIRRQEAQAPAPGLLMESINQLAHFRDNTRLKWRDNIFPKILTWKGRSVLVAHNQVISIENELLAVWEYIQKQHSVTIRDLPFTEVEDRIGFAQELVNLGLWELNETM